MKYFKNINWLNVSIIIGLIIAIILWGIGYGMSSNNKQSHVNYNSGSWDSATSAFTTSQIGPRRTYWLIPKEKNPNGGWDSVGGWYESETPVRHEENMGLYGNQKFSPVNIDCNSTSDCPLGWQCLNGFCSGGVKKN